MREIYRWFWRAVSSPLIEKPWMRDPIIMIIDPNITHHLRPNVSLTNGMRGSPRQAPRGRAEARMPLRPPCGFPKSASLGVSQRLLRNQTPPTEAANLQTFQAGTSCTALMIWESKPEVISMPIQQGNSMRYMKRKFLFFHHGNGSSSAMRWTMLSLSIAAPTMMSGLFKGLTAWGWNGIVLETRRANWRAAQCQGGSAIYCFIYISRLPLLR